MLIVLGGVVTGVLVNAITAVGRQVSKAASGLRKPDEALETARWFETFRLTGNVPDLPDLSPESAERLAGILGGDEVQAALQGLLAVRLTDAPETDGARAREAIRAALSAAGPDAGASAVALAGYYDDQVCALVARLEAEEPPVLAQIRSEAFSSRMISILHAIERNTAGAGNYTAPAGEQPGAPAGRPLAEVNEPFALEVHRPVQADDPPPGLPELPAYVAREHDRELAAVVRAAAGGGSGIAVLVGGSSTGKTRACWEALGLLRERPEEWRLWHPIDPTRPEAALDELGSVGPRTVVWLNEAQFYLDAVAGGLGERVAAGLREALRDQKRAPVLVLATLWPQRWDALTARPAAGADLHAQARELLGGRDIAVPSAFTAGQLQQLAAAHGNTSEAAALVQRWHSLHPHTADPEPAQWAADHASLDDPHAVALLLGALRAAGAGGQVAALAARAADHASLDHGAAVTWLLEALREAGAEEQARTLVARLPAEGRFNLFLKQPGHEMRYRFGRELDGNPAPSWGWDDLD